MLDIQHDKLRERVNNAIVHIRLIASRVKRANVADAAQKCEVLLAGAVPSRPSTERATNLHLRREPG